MLGLPDHVTACLFDLDGVLTQTAKVHARAWKEMFDAYLATHDQPPFDIHDDYDEYVDGRPRADGVRSFLHSRGIELPDGKPDDPPAAETVNGLGNRKNEIVLRIIHDDGSTPTRARCATSRRRAKPGCSAPSSRRRQTRGMCSR